MENKMNLQPRLGGGNSGTYVLHETKRQNLTERQVEKIQRKAVLADETCAIDEIADMLITIIGYVDGYSATIANVINFIRSHSEDPVKGTLKYCAIALAWFRHSNAKTIETDIPCYINELGGEAVGVPKIVNESIVAEYVAGKL